MLNRAIHLLTLVLCVTVAAAQACACRQPARAARHSADAHACCTSEKPTPTPTPAAPCPQCQHNVAAAPKSADVVSAAELAPVLAFVTKNHSLALATACTSRASAEDVLIPPLLRDLHHLSAQLTE
jgi:hypothetical protein